MRVPLSHNPAEERRAREDAVPVGSTRGTGAGLVPAYLTTAFPDQAGQLGQLADLGTRQEPNLEAVAAVKPDLILVNKAGGGTYTVVNTSCSRFRMIEGEYVPGQGWSLQQGAGQRPILWFDQEVITFQAQIQANNPTYNQDGAYTWPNAPGGTAWAITFEELTDAPLMATATSACDASSAPCAMLHAVATDTAPKVSSTSELTRTSATFDSFE